MLIYLGADHRGFNLKEFLKIFLKNQGYETADLGNVHYDETDDYPDFASAVAKKVRGESGAGRGILVCGSGAGVDITANKFRDVRAALGISPDQIYQARHHDNINILCLASDFTTEADAQKIVAVFLETPFDPQPRHQRRLDKISEIENQRQYNR